MAETRAAPEIVAPPTWRCLDFISDLHLAEDTPNAFAAWHDYLHTTRADAVFILGDLFEAWIGDDSRHDGFEARGAAVLTEAAARRRLFFMVGNRDFLLGHEMLAACGVEGLADPTIVSAFGERALLTHGDAWCLADAEYQKFRLQVRSAAWRAQILARSLAERRQIAKHLRSESERSAEQAGGEYADVDTPTALGWLTDTRSATLVHGHTHRPATEALASGLVRHVLSDWHLDGDGAPRADVLRWQASGWTRIAPGDAAR